MHIIFFIFQSKALSPPADGPFLPTKLYHSPFDNGATHVKNMASEFSTKRCKDRTPESKLGRKRKKTNEGRFHSPVVCSEKSFEHTSEPSLDWIEEEMAKVCGEGTAAIFEQPKPAFCQAEKFSTKDTKQVLSNPPDNELSDKDFTTTCNWHLLRLKNEADLEKRLKRVEEVGGIEKRAKLEKRFLDLFGPDEKTLNYPTGKNLEKKERDELAALTVKHLMPMYKKQKIASRDLFKKLAKHISDNLLEKLNAPGTVLKIFTSFC